MFGVIRVNDEESNELLFLVGYEPIRGHGLSVIRWILWNSTHTTTKLNFSLPRKRQKKGERRPRPTTKNALIFPRTWLELDRRADDSLSLKFHPFRMLHNIVTRDNKFFHTFGQFFWRIIDWMTRLDQIQGWIGTQNLSSSVSLWSDDQRKLRPNPTLDSGSYFYCAVSRMKVGWTLRHLLICTFPVVKE